MRDVSDPHRPIVHFTAPSNWLNDPNGLIHHRGTFHMFYQHNPLRAEWGRPHWGHAVSRDLVRWQDRPVALTPDDAGPDKDGCFSGCCVPVAGVPTIYYTGVQPQCQCMATPLDDTLDAWQKHPANPIIPTPPGFCAPREFRDPFVFEHEGQYRMLVGSGVGAPDDSFDVQRGVVLQYQSPDGRDWRYLSNLHEHATNAEGANCECPSFFTLRNAHGLERWCLVYTTYPNNRTTWYRLGDFDGRRLTGDAQVRLETATNQLAPLTFHTADGRRIYIGWCDEARPGEQCVKAGWAGCMTLPRELFLTDEGHLGQRPAAEVRTLREAPLNDPSAEAVELELAGEADGVVEVLLRATPDRQEQTRLRFDAAAGVIEVDRRRSSLDPFVTRDLHTHPLTPAPAGPLRVRLFIDRSVVEYFVNDQVTGVFRIYPTRSDATHIEVLHGTRKGAWRLSQDD